MNELAKIAYEAYRRSALIVNYAPLPSFEKLSAKTQEAWSAAAAAVEKHLTRVDA